MSDDLTEAEIVAHVRNYPEVHIAFHKSLSATYYRLSTMRNAAQAILSAAPDVDPAKATRADVKAMADALDAVWAALFSSDVPPSRRGADVEGDAA